MRILALCFLSLLAFPAFGQGTFSRAQLTNNFTTNFPSAGNKSISAEKLRASLQKMIEASAHYSELLAVSNSLSAQDAALINAFSNTIQSVFYFTGPTNGSGYYAGISTNGQLVKTPIAIGSGGSVSFDPSTNNLIKDGAGGKIVYPEPNYEPHVDHFDSATDGTIAFGVTNKVLGIKYGAKLTNSVLEGAMATGGNIITTLVPGANVTITGTGNTRTISATGSGGGGNTIYNADDSLTGNRIVNEAGFGLVFTNSSGTRFYVTPGSVTSAVFGLFNDGSGAKSEATLVGTNGVTSVNYLSLSGAYGGFQTILRNAAASEYAQIYGEYAAGAPLIITEARTSSTVKVLDTMTQSLRQSDAVNGSANSRLEQNSTGIAVGLSTIMPPKNSKAAFASINYNTTGGNGNLTVSHDYSLYTYTGTGGHTITLPSTSSSRGRTFAIFNAGTGALTLSLAVTVSGGTTITSLAANEYLLIFYDNGVTIRGFKQ